MLLNQAVNTNAAECLAQIMNNTGELELFDCKIADDALVTLTKGLENICNPVSYI